MIGTYLIACPPLALPPSGFLSEEDLQPGGWAVVCPAQNTWAVQDKVASPWELLAKEPGPWVEVPKDSPPFRDCDKGPGQYNCP